MVVVIIAVVCVLVVAFVAVIVHVEIKHKRFMSARKSIDPEYAQAQMKNGTKKCHTYSKSE